MCNAGYGGSNCADYNLKCHFACTGCTGPNASDCTECHDNALRNSSGACECKPEYESIDSVFDKCSYFKGAHCDAICIDDNLVDSDIRTCDGPGRGQCKACILNSHRNLQGECECDYGWTGPTCTTYEGECHPRCNKECHGPDALHCNSCVVNAVRDNRVGIATN